jgi:hypothetical protein
MDEPSIPLPEAADIHTLSTALDGAGQEQRLAWLQRLAGKQLPMLYELAAGQTLKIEELHGEEGQVVIHQGMNSMAMFRSFQKRMVLHDGQVKGHNHQPWAWLVGDGTFIVVPSPEVEGELWLDYTRLPDSGFPDFPPVKDNMAGLSRFAYGGMIDVVRRVSAHVTIGKAFIGDKPRGQYFALCRREDG